MASPSCVRRWDILRTLFITSCWTSKADLLLFKTQVTLLMIVTGPDARKFDVPAGLSRISDFYRITHLLTTSEG